MKRNFDLSAKARFAGKAFAAAYLVSACGGSITRTVSPSDQSKVPSVATSVETTKDTPPPEPPGTRPGPTPPPPPSFEPNYPRTSAPGSPRPLPDGSLAEALKGITYQVNGDPEPQTLGPFTLPTGTQAGGSSIDENHLFFRYDFGKGRKLMVFVKLVDRTMPMTVTVIDVLEITVGPDEDMSGDCRIDSKHVNYSAIGIIPAGKGGELAVREAWQAEASSGRIVSVKPERVTCFVFSGEPTK
jgi:hypothetical protein